MLHKLICKNGVFCSSCENTIFVKTCALRREGGRGGEGEREREGEGGGQGEAVIEYIR